MSTNLPNMQDRNTQTLKNITNLQNIEMELYNNLQQGVSSGQLTSQQQKTIISRINEISQIRVNLYANLKDMYGFIEQNTSSVNSTLAQQIAAVNIVENELNEAKKRLNRVQTIKNNKLRQTEINTYYGKSYSAHSNIMVIIVIVCVLLLILTFLANREIIPRSLYGILSVIIVLIGAVAVIMKILDISNRDEMNFDEYDWNFDKSKAPTASSSGTAIDPWGELPSLTCIGSACCYDGSTYDSTQNMCLPSTSST